MNEQSRQFGVLVGGLAVVAGSVWFAGVRPLMAALADDRMRLASDLSEVNAARRSSDPEQTLRATGLIAEQAEAYRRLWAAGADASALYERFQTLALTSGVRVERVEPRSSGASVRNKADAHELKVEPAVSGYKLDVRGEFEAVARFVHALETQTGLTRLDTIRMAPAADAPGLVDASIQTTHVNLAGALAAGEADAPRGRR